MIVIQGSDPPVALPREASGLDGFDEVGDDREDAVRRLDELDTRAVGDDLLLDVADTAVRDAPLDDDRIGRRGSVGIRAASRAGAEMPFRSARRLG